MRGRQIDLLDGPPAKSHHANDLTDDARRCQDVLKVLSSCGKMGATADEIARFLHLRTEQVGPALGELRMWNRVRKTEARRNGRAVYISILS
jgi:hypothetical protein